MSDLRGPMPPTPLTAFTAARHLTLEQRFDWGIERVGLPTARGRVLAEDVVADRPLPPFDRVTLDGIALDYAVYRRGRRHFPAGGVHAAGDPARDLADPEGCLEVMTGSVLPQGATAVARYEDVAREGAGFRVAEGLKEGTGIHRRGSDAEAGTTLLRAGRVVTPAVVGVLASCGYAEVAVRRLPRVAIVTTGDELVDVREAPLPHQLRRSNGPVLAALLATLGIEAEVLHLPDDRPALRAALGAQLAECEVVILSGGVSRGRFDYVPEVLTELGARRLLHRVAQRPGKPLWVGRTDATMVFGLPGNPVSTLACAVAYVGPWLRRCLGLGNELSEWGVLSTDLAFAPTLTLLKTVRVVGSDDHGARVVEAVGGGSGDLAGAGLSSGFLVLPAEAEGFRAGQPYAYLRSDTLLG